MPSNDSCGSASTTDSSSYESSQSTFSSSPSQRNCLRKRITVRKLKKSQRLRKSHRPKTKLLYNHYVGPGDNWAFLSSSDPSDESLYIPLPSPSSDAIHQLQVPPSYDIMGTQDPFDLLGSDFLSLVMTVLPPVFIPLMMTLLLFECSTYNHRNGKGHSISF